MKKVTEFSPNFPLLKAIRFSNSASLSDLCVIAGLDPSVDFKDVAITDLDFQGSDPGAFVVRSDIPELLTAQQMEDFIGQLAVSEASDEKGKLSLDIDEHIEGNSTTDVRGFRSFSDSIANAVNATGLAISRDGLVPAIPTGFVDLDRTLGGLRKSELILLAAVPSMGKTAFATQLAMNIAGRVEPGNTETNRALGGVVGYFTFQHSSDQITQRLLAIESEIGSHKIRQGDLTEAEFKRFVDAAKEMEDIPMYIDDSTSDIESLIDRASKLKRRHGLDVLFVDMLDDLLDGRPNSAKFKSEIAENLKKLKRLARQLDVCVFVMSNLYLASSTRNGKRPRLGDLDELGGVGQVADTVLLLHSDAFFIEQDRPEDYELEAFEEWKNKMEYAYGKVEVIVAKNRNGPMGAVDLAFDGVLMRFGNMAKPWLEAEMENY